ncbi:hypothetical protein PRIPAC_85612 [Pristionchus pacificus]|uniref:C-type lectin n=1 Tax=Pristionchus pacificus TaxID=54126 RepID=A0A454XX35_PRIPA|nr:hypothetical protein PRIPAC_85612 [Pristionchus pacificus]|eukprot:PDM76601.1 C-type lectin [Pristionchus pacificus]
MRALLLLSFLIVLLAAKNCPPQYQLIQDRCIRLLELEKVFVIDDALPAYRAECAKDGGHLPVIKNDQDNAQFSSIVYALNGNAWKDFYLMMDLFCDSTTKRLQWMDGTPVTYSRRDSIALDVDCYDSQLTAISEVEPQHDEWSYVSTQQKLYGYTVICDYDGPEIAGPCGDYAEMDTSSSAEKKCFKIFTEPMSWNDASKQCAADSASLITINSDEENRYIWRTAISSYILDGLHIGAHASPADASVWTWSDGDVPITGNVYNNFVNGFPLPGGGECSSMLTGTTAAYWINDNCDSVKRPFMCRRAKNLP